MSDERRKVAERLRELAISDATSYAEPFCEQLTDIVDFPFDETNKLSNVADNLADLIDPTTEPECEIAYHPLMHGYACSCCGIVYMRPGAYEVGRGEFELRYCPNCGARVARVVRPNGY